MTRAGDVIDAHNDIRNRWLEDTLTVRNFEQVIDDRTGSSERSPPTETEWPGRIDTPNSAERDASGRGTETSADAVGIIDSDAPVHSGTNENPYASRVVSQSGRVYEVIGAFDLGTGRTRVELQMLDD